MPFLVCAWNTIAEPISAGLSCSITHLLLAAPSSGRSAGWPESVHRPLRHGHKAWRQPQVGSAQPRRSGASSGRQAGPSAPHVNGHYVRMLLYYAHWWSCVRRSCRDGNAEVSRGGGSPCVLCSLRLLPPRATLTPDPGLVGATFTGECRDPISEPHHDPFPIRRRGA
jgi:hypothetical protein